MTLKTEYSEWLTEQARVERKLSAQGRAFARWFPPRAEPSHFVWRDPFAGAPSIADFQDRDHPVKP